MGRGRLVGIGAMALGAGLAACLSPQAAPPSEDAGAVVFFDAAPPAEDVAAPPTEDVAAPPVDAGPPDAGTDAADSAPPPPSCGSDNGGCPPNSVCAIDAGVVCVCDPGYSGATCTSDCLVNNGGCGADSVCANGDAGVVCTCVAGYEGDAGGACTSVCVLGTSGCDPNATCANVDGGITCTCNAGYNGTGTTCASDCLTSNGGCDPNATCSLGVAGVVCTCDVGFTGNGTSCASDDYTEWPAPSDGPPENAYTVSADGVVVLDGVTGLVWQRQLFADPCPGDGTGTCTWPDANTYCGSLNAMNGGAGLEGVTGWRVPSIVELFSIVNFDDGSPAIDTAVFPATPATVFWAHTPDAADATQSWSVTFATGFSATQATTTDSNVRCVTSIVPAATTPTCGTAGLACCYAGSCGADLECAGGTCVPASDYMQSAVPSDSPLESSSTVSADGTLVTDGVTGLHWQRSVLANPCPADIDAGVDAGATGGGCTWSDAQAYCASLDAVGGTGLGGIAGGWRLPSVVELLGIVSYTAGSPALDTALFPDTPPVGFWTLTPNAANGAQAWSVTFATGFSSTQAVSSVSEVRCVSSVAPSAATPTCGTSSLSCCYAASCGPDLACNASSSTCSVDTNYAQSLLPADTPPEPGYTVSTGGSVVTDGVTGLVWQRQVLASPCPGDVDAGATTGGCTWSDAATYCASMNGLGLGGYSAGWRLPSVTELLSIVSYTATPLIDPSPFANPPSTAFWSATPNASATGQAWSVSYATGGATSQATPTVSGVRCVNSGGVTPAPEGCGGLGQACCYASTCGATLYCAGATCVTDTNYTLGQVPPDAPPAGQYTLSADTAAATDTVTGLTWLRAAGGANPCPGDGAGVCTLAHAATFCANLNATAPGGLSSGWRLPSLVELLSIVNYSVASGPMVDTGVFTGVTAAPYWSATPAAGNAGQGWAVDFSKGASALDATSAALAPLCVN